MHARALRRAAALGATASLLALSVAVADTLPADGDDVTPGIQGTVPAGPVAPGGHVDMSVWFELTCKAFSHVDVGQSVNVSISGVTVPPGGAVAGGGTTIGPVPSTWAPDGLACTPGSVLRSATPASVRLTAPGSTGTFDYTISYDRSLSPAGNNDAVALSSLTVVTFRLTVVPDAPPTLSVPVDMTVEGDTAGGAMVSWSATATDDEDDPDPTPTCAPASGTLFSLGSTPVSCSVSDSAGHTVGGGFSVTVVDTTAPTLQGMPSSVTLEAGSPAGTTAAYTPPTATDVVDTAPTVDCSPAVGAAVPVGTTTVSCTATDDSGNSSSGSFPLTVTYTVPVQLEAVFDAPIGPTNTVGGAAGRNVPVKVAIFRDGVAQTSGAVDLVLRPCDGGADLRSPLSLSLQGSRWVAGLDTSGLTGCVTATVRLDGSDAGSFAMRFPDAALPTAHASTTKLRTTTLLSRHVTAHHAGLHRDKGHHDKQHHDSRGRR